MVFSESQQKVLEALYEKGMTSKGKDSLALRQKAVEETGADMSSVVNWIGNYKKRLFGKQREKSKITHTKGPSGYNIFVQENKDSLPAFAEWGSKWKSLTVEKQEEYKNKAASYKRHPQKDEKHEKMFLKKLRELLAEMLSVGLDFAAVGTKINGHYVVVGDGKTADLLLVNNDLATKIAGQEFETDERGNVKELRKKAQEHMNKLYGNIKIHQMIWKLTQWIMLFPQRCQQIQMHNNLTYQ